ncbi:MAG TPA: branched-chain amino acid ABC transporter permease [Acidimicrobiales bacterium]|nr:branched-chain amino acid ABC transporter permease [Acidimicrobiales bacterium]
MTATQDAQRGEAASPLGHLLAFVGRGRSGADVLARPSRAGVLSGAVLLALGIAIPFIGLHIGAVLPGAVDVLDAPGTLEVLGLCFAFATVALGFDLLFGVAGLLSFGHVLFFALGVYVLDIALSDWHLALAVSILLTAGVSLGAAVVIGALCLRVGGIAFAMVTLAVAQAGYYLIESNPKGSTGGDNGLVMSTDRLPGALVGVPNTKWLYWIALGILVLAYAAVKLATEARIGRVWLAIRENEQRVEVLGLRPFSFKLAAFVLSSLVATAGGISYLLLIGTASPSAVASTTVTVSILVMVVLGGVATRWGAVLGACAYVYLQQLLDKLVSEPSFASLPAALRDPLSEPDFLLGAIFVLVVLFAPGGLASIVYSLRAGAGLARWRRGGGAPPPVAAGGTAAAGPALAAAGARGAAGERRTGGQ